MKKIISLIIFISFLTACSEPVHTLTPLHEQATILAFGDSLTYGTGADHDTESYPSILQQLTGLKVVNAGVPGEVSKEGLNRLPQLLTEIGPDLVILCHGGNDLIRRMDKKQLKANLEQMIALIKDSGAEVMLVAVPAFGLTLRIPDLYVELAEKYQLPIETESIPELESEPSLKSDQVHPNATGYTLLAEDIYSLMQQSNAIVDY